MITQEMLHHYYNALITGERTEARKVVEKCLQSGIPANQVYMDLLWPAMIEIDKDCREELLNSAQEHMATRINRTLVDQLQNKLPSKPRKDKKIVICCAENEHGELGAQMAADLFESDGWQVRFLGGGIDNEDLTLFVNGYSPDVLLIFGSTPSQAPGIRTFIDNIRDIDACPEMGIMLSGGLFGRADGLWEEIGADMYAATAAEAIQLANAPKEQRPVPVRTINTRKRSQKAAS